jgi:hypothetical protein
VLQVVGAGREDSDDSGINHVTQIKTDSNKNENII